jgi:hypothetical protein
MKVFDKVSGMATDVGEFWRDEAEEGTPIIIDMTINEDLESVDFCYHPEQGSNEVINLIVPVDRLRKLLREAKKCTPK